MMLKSVINPADKLRSIQADKTYGPWCGNRHVVKSSSNIDEFTSRHSVELLTVNVNFINHLAQLIS